MRDWLIRDCQQNFSFHISNNQLHLDYPWGVKGGAFSRICVHLAGINQFTGNPLDRNDYLFNFSSASHSVTSKELPLYGNYELHFDALQIDGSWITDFHVIRDVRVRNTAYRPFIHYSTQKKLSGWTEITVSSNCYRRLDGKLWLLVEGHYQKVPNMTSNELQFSVATKAEDIKVLFAESSDSALVLKPEKTD